MKIIPVSFGNTTIKEKRGNILIEQEFDDNNHLKYYREKDLNIDEYIKSEEYNEAKELISKQEFKFIPTGKIETFWSKEYSYKRIITNFIKDELAYNIEQYFSSNPEKNYVHERIRDMSGKLISLICNGEKII